MLYVKFSKTYKFHQSIISFHVSYNVLTNRRRSVTTEINAIDFVAKLPEVQTLEWQLSSLYTSLVWFLVKLIPMWENLSASWKVVVLLFSKLLKVLGSSHLTVFVNFSSHQSSLWQLDIIRNYKTVKLYTMFPGTVSFPLRKIVDYDLYVRLYSLLIYIKYMYDHVMN